MFIFTWAPSADATRFVGHGKRISEENSVCDVTLPAAAVLIPTFRLGNCLKSFKCARLNSGSHVIVCIMQKSHRVDSGGEPALVELENEERGNVEKKEFFSAESRVEWPLLFGATANYLHAR